MRKKQRPEGRKKNVFEGRILDRGDTESLSGSADMSVFIAGT